MGDTFAQTLHDWQNFYMLTGTAAATLIGLLFVAASLGAGLIADHTRDNIRTFVTPTLLHFGAVLILACIFTVPGQSPDVLGALVAAIGVAGLAQVLKTVPQMWQYHQRDDFDRAHWLWHNVLPGVAYLLISGTGGALLLGARPLLSPLALGVGLLLVVGIHNTWTLTLWIVQHRTR
ncbi:MAG TPA: hypothetical protein VKY74_10520 [Chloroflexia bacterium]|nr:hypothetical protein [Chloroflexia bacterium]